MKCIKCNYEMKKANVISKISIYSDEISNPPRAPYQEPYTPTIAYVCEKCGYIELYFKEQTP